MRNSSLADNGFLKTFSMPYPLDARILGLKESVDNGILKYLSKEKGIPVSESPSI